MDLPRRRLPHLYVPGRPVFITFCLAGAVPARRFPPSTKPLSAGKAFVYMDLALERRRDGPLWLGRAEIADLVVESLKTGVQLGHYLLHAYVVMPNHVHVLLTPLVEVSRIMQSMKGFTSRMANRLLGRTGETFWQGESYDHLVRDREQFDKIVRYIHLNPVRAGLVVEAEDYRWSSAAGSVSG